MPPKRRITIKENRPRKAQKTTTTTTKRMESEYDDDTEEESTVINKEQEKSNSKTETHKVDSCDDNDTEQENKTKTQSAAPQRSSPRIKNQKKKEKAESNSKTKISIVDSSDDDNKEEKEKNNASSPSSRSSQRISNKQKKDKQEANLFGKWDKDDSVLILTNSTLNVANDLVYGFDLDSTLILTKSGKKFPVGRDDWQWLFPEVPKKLKELHSNNVKIIIFSNQAGIAKKGYDKSKADMITGKISDIVELLGFPIQALIATKEDTFRKPSTQMWDYFVTNLNSGKNPKKAIYVGDAAGRPDNWKPNKKKDFSCSDRKFAANIGIDFATPEEFFLNEKPAVFDWGLDPKTIPKTGAITKDNEVEFHRKDGKTEMVLFVGFPASGKSTFAKEYFVSHGYVHVNRDTLKTKCLKVAEEALASGKSVVIDNTNPSKDARAQYLSLANKYKIPVRCFHFEASQILANHLNYFRERVTQGESPHVSSIAYNIFKKDFVEPSLSEGFVEVKKINFVPKFNIPQHEKLFYQFA